MLVAQTCLTLCNPAPLSMEFFRQEYWGELPFPSPGDLPDPGIEPVSPALQAAALLLAIRKARTIALHLSNFCFAAPICNGEVDCRNNGKSDCRMHCHI